MSLFGQVEQGHANARAGGFIGRVLAVFVGGNYNSRALVILGLALFIVGVVWWISQSVWPLGLTILGLVCMHLAARNHERTLGPKA